ncbi:uncharacterized protein LOC132387959 isoform X2 [Hypanus sabinus]|uniref:uncharacterized protein LOC132387959 isoform X2 n=1 Tax=Hypanus sabinus TaxID=79690 RepID=UPI0028C49DE2|nr:uncharacterized protein LOC132387959 isoform X2 [Hypanus sabinus]
MQRIFDRMDDSEAHMNKKPRITGSRAPSRDGLDPTYSQLNFRNNELLIAKDEDPPVTSRAGEKPETAQAAAQERKSKVKIGNRPYRLVYLLCLVTSALIVTVAGFSIYVSQIRQSQITCDQNHRLLREEVNRTLRQCRLQVHQLNTTLLSTISENSHMHLTQRTSLEHLSALISNLSDLKRRHSDLRHQFTEMETKYRSVNETKAQICELLTSRREVCYESCTRPKQFILEWKMPRRVRFGVMQGFEDRVGRGISLRIDTGCENGLGRARHSWTDTGCEREWAGVSFVD